MQHPSHLLVHVLLLPQKKCSIKLFSKAVFKVLKVIFHQIQNIYDKSPYKQFFVTENSKPILEKTEKINCKTNTKAISTSDFSTLHTKLPHLDVLY